MDISNLVKNLVAGVIISAALLGGCVTDHHYVKSGQTKSYYNWRNEYKNTFKDPSTIKVPTYDQIKFKH